jgi:hypothetical protein
MVKVARTASILCGVLFLTPVANVVFAAEAKVVMEQILGEAIPYIQNMMVSVSQGCSGGPNGRPPEGWPARQAHGNAAVVAFSDARAALLKDQIPIVLQKVNSGLSEFDTLVSSLHENCSGGPHGEDPVNYGAYVGYRNSLRDRLETAKRFL